MKGLSKLRVDLNGEFSGGNDENSVALYNSQILTL